MTAGAFRTVDGTTVPAVTAEEMAAVDRVAVEEFGIDLRQLMEHAGRSLAAEVLGLARDPAPAVDRGTSARPPEGRTTAGRLPAGDGPVAVVAGGGGNGGGGLVAARHLRNRDVAVTVVLDRDPADLEGVVAHQHAILEAMDVPVRTGPEQVASAAPAVVVDAVIGYGLDGELRGTAAALVDAIADASAPVVSLDVPSGRDATTGEVLGDAVEPSRVLTLALPKRGLHAVNCPLVLADIGVPPGVYRVVGIDDVPPFPAAFRVALEQGSA